jgi:hypothetical protein
LSIPQLECCCDRAGPNPNHLNRNGGLIPGPYLPYPP